ncbi:30S ribosomal protein S1 [Rhabdochromatium marinum]|uniref:30S ribosomal protein S1 n=1 Tax=Rhabdochromatium marinum TaxID=48729 RepID=UPI00190406AE|nr:30S ribosomal protein S1 [Rhabdochromatium marinum]MBK1647095.1 30S ribosomal protein S1 [Rhabdochromatium marinum]
MTEETSFAALLEESEPAGQRAPSQPKVGDQVQGEIVAINADQVFISIGGKMEALMDIANVTAGDGSLSVQLGDTYQARVTSIDPDTGALLLGQRHGRALHGAEELEAAYNSGQPIEGQITGVIKGGVEVQIAGHRAFCPASQIDLRFIDDLSTLVGQRHEFRITKYSGGRRLDLVVSRRALLEEAQAAAAEETRARLEVGAVLTGTVTQLKEFGAFVDLGGVEGMVHISELAFGHVKHPEEILTQGQEVEVQVLRIEQTNNPKRPEKIALSIRALAKDPWADAVSRFPVGTRITGTISRLQSFGAFVELSAGLDGLIHISELGAGRRIAHPQEVVENGQAVEVRILSVDPERRRIALALVNEGEALTASEVSAQQPRKEPSAATGKDSGLGTFGELLREQMRRS